MPRTTQNARRSTGGTAPRKQGLGPIPTIPMAASTVLSAISDPMVGAGAVATQQENQVRIVCDRRIGVVLPIKTEILLYLRQRRQFVDVRSLPPSNLL
jgi:hypothetical protein